MWRALREFEWDHNEAYKKMFQVGMPKRDLRIAPPSMVQGIRGLKYLMRIWPSWFDRVDQRLPGIRTAARYGKRALEPVLNEGETWEAVMYRLIEEARTKAPWLHDRMTLAVKQTLQRHNAHSNSPYPMTHAQYCASCRPSHPGCWEHLAKSLYNGDPWVHYNMDLPYLEPYELRPGAKPWFEPGKKGGGLTW